MRPAILLLNLIYLMLWWDKVVCRTLKRYMVLIKSVKSVKKSLLNLDFYFYCVVVKAPTTNTSKSLWNFHPSSYHGYSVRLQGEVQSGDRRTDSKELVIDFSFLPFEYETIKTNEKKINMHDRFFPLQSSSWVQSVLRYLFSLWPLLCLLM